MESRAGILPVLSFESLYVDNGNVGDSTGYSNWEIRCLELETGAREAGFLEEEDFEGLMVFFWVPKHFGQVPKHPRTASHLHPPCSADTLCLCMSRAGV